MHWLCCLRTCNINSPELVSHRDKSLRDKIAKSTPLSDVPQLHDCLKYSGTNSSIDHSEPNMSSLTNPTSIPQLCDFLGFFFLLFALFVKAMDVVLLLGFVLLPFVEFFPVLLLLSQLPRVCPVCDPSFLVCERKLHVSLYYNTAKEYLISNMFE